MATTGSSQISEKDIQKAIDDYLQNAPPLFKKFISGPSPPQENYMFNLFGQQQYLLITKFDLAKLPVRILRRLAVHLVRQFVVQVELDSLWYWALTHDVVESSAGNMVFRQWPLRASFTTMMAAHFARLGSAPMNSAIYRLNQVIRCVVPQPVWDLVINKHIVLMYMCYPVLEGLLKFAMSPFVDSNGRVITSFSDGRDSYKPGNKISSLARLLRSLEVNAQKLLSKPDLGIDLKDFRRRKLFLPKRNLMTDGIQYTI